MSFVDTFPGGNLALSGDSGDMPVAGWTKETGEPTGFGQGNNIQTAWGTFVSAVAETYRFDFSQSVITRSDGQTGSKQVAALTGSAVNALSTVSWANSSPFIYYLNAAAGVTYRIQLSTGPLSGQPPNTGNFRVLWTPHGPDFFPGRTISGASGTTSCEATHFSRSSSSFEPQWNGEYQSAWFSWTAPFTGRFTFDTFGSTVNTNIGVYTGSSMSSSMPRIATDYDSQVGGKSKVTFNATAGTIYRIQVGTPSTGWVGNYTLNWQEFVPVAPTITLQPVPKTTYDNVSVTFSSGATGDPAPTVQWYRRARTGEDPNWYPISGATSSSYSYAPKYWLDDQTRYRATYTNSGGSVTTDEVLLTVLLPYAGDLTVL